MEAPEVTVSFCQDGATNNNQHKNLIMLLTLKAYYIVRASKISRASVESLLKYNRVEVRVIHIAYVTQAIRT